MQQAVIIHQESPVLQGAVFPQDEEVIVMGDDLLDSGGEAELPLGRIGQHCLAVGTAGELVVVDPHLAELVEHSGAPVADAGRIEETEIRQVGGHGLAGRLRSYGKAGDQEQQTQRKGYNAFFHRDSSFFRKSAVGLLVLGLRPQGGANRVQADRVTYSISENPPGIKVGM